MKKVLPHSFKCSQGFTLVELLVVVAILAILMMVGAAVFSGTQKNARDTKRRADIEAISKAMEVKYGSTPGQYAALTNDMFASGKVPEDPLTGQLGCGTVDPKTCDYCKKTVVGPCNWAAGGDTKVALGTPAIGTSYVVCANLEQGTGTGNYFCLKSQQQDQN